MADRLTFGWTVDVRRDAEEVYDYLADFARHAEWSPKPFRVEGLAPGPVHSGSTFVSYGVIPGDKEHRNEVEVTDASRPTRLAFTAKEPNGDLFFNTFTITSGTDAARVELQWDIPKPTGFIGFVFPVFLRVYIKPHGQKGLNKMKQNLESATG